MTASKISKSDLFQQQYKKQQTDAENNSLRNML